MLTLAHRWRSAEPRDNISQLPTTRRLLRQQTAAYRLFCGPELPVSAAASGGWEERLKLLSAYLHCSPALLMEFKHTTMATPSPNNPTAPSSHNNGSNNAGSAANHHHQSQSQHITTTLSSGMQGEWGSRRNVCPQSRELAFCCSEGER